MAAPPGGNGLLRLIVVLTIGCFAVTVWFFPENPPPPFNYDDAGNPQLQPGRLEKMEKELNKLDEYPILPENIKRRKPILRPPGNKKDS